MKTVYSFLLKCNKNNLNTVILRLSQEFGQQLSRSNNMGEFSLQTNTHANQSRIEALSPGHNIREISENLILEQRI